eukprot:g1476.t1
MDSDTLTRISTETARGVSLQAPVPIEAQQCGIKSNKNPSHWNTEASNRTCLATDGSTVMTASTHSVSVDFSELTETETGVQEYVNLAIGQLEKRLELILDSISDELNSEVSLERQHLVLMQEKVDNQGQTLQKEFTELHKKMNQESTIRAMVQQKYREQNETVDDNIKLMTKELAELRSTVNQLQQPWMYRAINSVYALFQQCSPTTCNHEKLLPDDSSQS